MSMDSAVSIGWDVLKWVVVPVKRQFGYVISSKSYAQDLQKEVGKLAYEADMVHNDVEVARNNSREVYSHVAEWQAKAEKALKEARDLLGDFEKASKTCCYGSLHEPCCRYQFSRKAKHMIEGIQRLAQEFSEFKYISFSGTAPGNAAASTPAKREGKDVVQSTISMASASFASRSIKLKDDGMVQSRELIMQEIMAALADNNNSVVGIYGMGGVGKSTLLDDAERRIKKAKSFDWVAKADVSENQDIKRIQGEIAHALDLDIKDVEYVNSRAERLRTRLENEVREKKKVLIILDNLWKGLDLKSVGIPCGHNNKVIGCKLLLTSRFQDVLRREMGCDRDFLLDALKEEEAKRLFERTVGDKVHHDPFKSLVDEALNKCAGLPFLIIAMANVFRDADFREWKDVLRQIEMSTNKGIDEKINEMLQLSYNRFKGEYGKEVKSLLRLCVVYGVSKPSLENLVRYGVGSRLFREDSSMEEVRDRLSSLIRTLKASSFLLEDNEDVDGFKIHDLVRGFIASVASRDDPLLVLKNHDKSVIELPKDKLKSCTSVCFPYVDMEELPEDLDCPEMRIFLLFTNNESLKVPSSCFNSMRKLMVLHLSQVRLTRSPSPFQFLENLHTLCLNDCSLEDVAMISELKRLCVLSFANSKIQRLPKEIGQLVELRLLDLNHCSKLEIIEPGVLGSLMKLEELYMENSFDRWNDVEQTPPTNAGLIELNNLKNFCTLYVSILDPSVLPQDLNVEKLTKYQIRIGNVPRWRSRNVSKTLEPSSTLELRLDPMSDILRKGCIETLLGKPDGLILDGLNGIEQSICALSQKGFPKLKHLQVKNSPSVHHVLQLPSHTEFKMLESLLFDNLINLEKICNNHISSNSFSALKVVRVENCDKMEVLFPLSLLRELPHLEEIQVVSCHLMREIVEVDDCGKLELRNLHVLNLHDLPNMKNFCTVGMAPSSCASNDHVGTQVAFFNGQQVAFPSLETLRITWMDSIEIIWDNQVAAESFCKLKSLRVYGCNKLLKRVWDKELHSQVKFQCLHSVTVSRCDSLTSLFPTSVARDLMQLEELKINGCGGIVELIEKEGLVPRDVFPKLTSLELNHLPELKCIYTGTHALRWPALKILKVDGCSKVEILASQLENEMPPHKQPLFLIEKGAFSNLQELKLDLYGGMEIWHGHSHDGESFCKVRVLELCHFSKESAMSTCHLVRSLTNLQELVVRNSDIEELSDIVEAKEGPRHELKVIPPFSRFFQHLKTLDVSFCDGLSKMFTPTIAGNLVGLTKLRISKCKMLTEVICDDGGEEGLVVVFNQLKYMELDGLTGLRCFSSSKCTLMFPLLEDVIVSGCPSMKFFSEGPINTPKLERVQASTEAWFWKENLNITIQNMFKEMATFAGVKSMRLSEFPELIGKWHGELIPIKPSWQLESLVVDKCPSFTNAIPSRLIPVLNEVQGLQVRDCESLEEVFNLDGLEGVRSTRVLPILQDLDLVNLPKLQRLWNNHLQGMLRFDMIFGLTLYKCSNLRHAFTPSMARCVANLWRMEIKECGQMEGVIAEEEGQGSAVEKIKFPNLYWMKLECLPNMSSFLSGKNHRLECPKLAELSIAYCPKMRSLTRQPLMEIDHRTPSLFTSQVQFPKLQSIFLSHMENLSKIWIDSPQDTLTFEHLRKVKVDNCKSLENLFPHWVATSLNQLEKLRVEFCAIKEIVASGDNTPHSTTAQALFPQLTSLVFHAMPQLKRFCPNLSTLNWPFLKKLRVTHCDKLEHVSFGGNHEQVASKK
ncbi:LOW QUALITY PROTEIN: uncharacterized protein LOC115731513 [Rhodamnia argentea]|uniref:LOW QUALITY PROTEIN: uncharacterized protein LOC115731513 n=1 Tax=Rhodamnia argentea TaxID=178133 RepID=A0ABM3HG70_9MYRT|nr:LOW QUALITY PROTEIN: uncharacterized protein LOC115731513 [Rhodamnia argentea]